MRVHLFTKEQGYTVCLFLSFPARKLRNDKSFEEVQMEKMSFSIKVIDI